MTFWIAILFAAGIILILAEFLLPGLVAGVIGTALILTSAGLAIYHHPEQAIFIVAGELLGVILAIAAGMYFIGKVPFSGGLILGSSQQASAGYVAADGDMTMVGKEGTVMTALRPAGTISVDGKRIDAVSDGAFIDAGAVVRVTEIYGSRVVVRKIERQKETEGTDIWTKQ